MRYTNNKVERHVQLFHTVPYKSYYQKINLNNKYYCYKIKEKDRGSYWLSLSPGFFGGSYAYVLYLSTEGPLLIAMCPTPVAGYAQLLVLSHQQQFQAVLAHQKTLTLLNNFLTIIFILHILK